MIIFAVDDEPLLLNKLERAITEASPESELHGYPNATALLAALEEGLQPPDVAFLDIELPGMGGIELAKRIKFKSPKTWIVFVTGFSQYAVEAYKMHAKGYIMKPVSAEKIRDELNAPCHLPLNYHQESIIRVQCFGNFEVFANNKPLKFERSKTKELFAYLIDRNGAAVNTGELCAVLWEEQPDSEAQKNYFRKLIIDMSKTLSSVGAEDIFLKSRNSFAIDITKIDCDYHRFIKRDPNVINSYNGEYMTQYSWSELTLGSLEK